MKVDKLILFHLNNQMYGINVDYVYAIETITDIVSVPNAPKYIEGIINLRGSIVPVYSLCKKLNLSAKERKEDSQLIVVRCKEQVFAFIVDGVDEIYEMNSNAYMSPPVVLQSDTTSYLEGIVNVKGKLVLGVDVAKLLDESEKEGMQRLVLNLSEKE